MTTVVVDTNALMMPVECDVRLFDEVEREVGDVDVVVPRAVVDELDDLSAGAGEAATAASVGRDLADRCTVVETDATTDDDAVVAAATDPGIDTDYVVTNDGPLRARLLERDVPVISLRGRNKLATTRP